MDIAIDREREPAPGAGQVPMNWDGSGGWIGVWQNGPDHGGVAGLDVMVTSWPWR
jgi:hypothetical protein